MTGNFSEDLTSGVPGLDTIMSGGLPAAHAYLVKGSPGTGKTSLALQFLSEGVRRGESTVYVSFSESRHELQRVADSHGWPLDDIEVCELAAQVSQRAISGTSIFHGAEVDLPEVITTILDVVERVEPTRLAIDSLTAIRYMAENHRQYRRSLFQLKVSLEQAGVTTFFVGEKSNLAKTEAESLVHGVIDLSMKTRSYGPVHRHLQVTKLRGRGFDSGLHDFAIVTGGLEIYPRIQPETHHREIGSGQPVTSGVDSLDALLGGGIDHGTTSLIMGPSGTGKSTMLTQYAVAAAERGERALIFTFTEDVETIRRRASNLGMPLEPHLDSGRIRIQTLDTAEVSPGQFANIVREAIELEEVAFVAIDSLNGYIQAMPKRAAIVPHLHDLLMYLGRRGIIMMLVLTLSGLFGANPNRVANLSYLADTILYLRYFTHEGRIHKSIAAAKHRTRDHKKTVHEFFVEQGGVRVGDPLTHIYNLGEGHGAFEGAMEANDETETWDDHERSDGT